MVFVLMVFFVVLLFSIPMQQLDFVCFLMLIYFGGLQLTAVCIVLLYCMMCEAVI